MTRFLRAAAQAVAVAFVALPGASHAYQEITVPGVSSESHIQISAGLVFQGMPQSGFCPVHLKIRNGSGDAHVWELSVSSSGNPGNQASSHTTAAFAVPAGQVREFDLLVPRAGTESQGSNYEVLQGTMSGYGISGGHFALPTRYSGGLGSSFVVMSDTLANSAWSKVEAAMKTSTTPSWVDARADFATARMPSPSSSGRTLSGSAVKLAELPPDWRALSGVSGLWLTKEDWERLSADRRRAVRQWIEAGGFLFVASPAPALDSLPQLPAHLSEKLVKMGFGGVKAVQLTGGELSPSATADEIRGLDGAPLPAWESDYQGDWQLRKVVGWPYLHVPLIIGFVCLFGLVVGPLNLRVLAPPARRHRLFLTVPLISTVASVALFAVIAIADGFGGIGGRNVLLYLPAGENQATLLQEQIARSRLLFGRSFKLPESVQMAFVAQEREEDKGLSFERSGDILSGGWFRSRTVQTHALRASLPSRAEVITQPDSSAPDGPPVLLSSVASVLRDVQYVDPGGKYWKIDRLETGRPTKLQPSSRKEADLWLERVSADLSRHLRLTLKDVANRPGNFYAVGEPMPEGPIETLTSIHWNRQAVLCFGECTKGESR